VGSAATVAAVLIAIALALAGRLDLNTLLGQLK